MAKLFLVLVMALTYVSGEFAIGAGTGNLVIDTGSGVEGKAVRFMWTRQTAAGASAAYSGGEGWAVSSTKRCCLAWAGDDALATTNTARAFDGTRCIRLFSNGTPTQDGDADFVSFGTGADAGKFTINRVTAFGVNILVKYEYYAGTDITGTHIEKFTGPAAAVTGNRTYTGTWGFTGKYYRFMLGSSLDTAETTGAADMAAGIGQAVSSTQRQVCAWADDDNTTHASRGEGYMDSGLCWASYDPNAGGNPVVEDKADFVSSANNEFVLNHTLATNGSVQFFAVILGGTFQVALGQQARPTATGDQDITSPGFEPVGCSVVAGFPTANATETAKMHIIQGAGEATGTIVDHAVTCAADATINTNDDMRTIDTKIYVQIDNAGTIIAQADLTAWLSNGFRWNWPTVDANARLYQWTAWGSAAAVGTLSVSVSDSMTVTELIGRHERDFVSRSDAVVLAEAIAANLKDMPQVNEAIAIAEAITARLKAQPNVSEAVALAESLVIVLRQLKPSVADAVTIAESVVMNLKLMKSVSDAVAVLESVAMGLKAMPSVSDAVTVAEAIAARTKLQPAVSDLVSVAESLRLNLRLRPNVFDQIAVAEGVSVQIPSGFRPSVSDTIAVLEGITVRLKNMVSTFDSIVIAEAINANLVGKASASDLVSLAELAKLNIKAMPSASDIVSVAENLRLELKEFASTFDTVSVTESIAARLRSYVSVFEAVTVSDIMALNAKLGNAPVDNVTVTEFALARLKAMPRLSEALSVSEMVLVLIGFGGVSSFESISVSEFVSVLFAGLISEGGTIIDAGFMDTIDAGDMTIIDA